VAEQLARRASGGMDADLRDGLDAQIAGVERGMRGLGAEAASSSEGVDAAGGGLATPGGVTLAGPHQPGSSPDTPDVRLYHRAVVAPMEPPLRCVGSTVCALLSVLRVALASALLTFLGWGVRVVGCGAQCIQV